MSAPDLALDACTTCGEALKLLRRRARLSQRELSIATGYSESHISRIEHNERSLARHSLLALFVPALQLQDEPATVARWLALCTVAPSPQADAPRPTVAPSSTTPAAHRPVPALPVQLTSFIGRVAEVTNLCELLQQADVRLLTLTGAGGCGKTRLALRVAELVARRYAHGVHWVELAALENPDLLPHMLLERWALCRGASDDPLVALSDFMSSRRMLLVLDNCEHLVEAVARLAMTLLRACPGLQMVATSREALAVPGEVTYPVQPMALPPALRGASPRAAEIMPYEAIQLFVARSQAVFPDFVLTDHNAGAVAAICQRLDGIPLGIELAAAWMSILVPQQLAEHLQANFTLLVDQRRGALPRHQTLRAAIEWSYRLLAEPERALLRCLAIFRGAWSLAIAEAIAGEAGIDSAQQLLPMLNRLIGKSLITVDHRGENDTWYRLLEPLRDYLLTALSEEEAARVQACRLHYYAQIAEAVETGLSGDQQQHWLNRLEREHDNLRAALGWGCDHGGAPAQLAAQLAAHIWRFWLVRGHYAEGRRWLEQMLARAAPAEDVRIRLLYGAGVLARLQLDLDAAAQFAREHIELATQVNDQRGLADGYGVLGWIEEFLGNMQQALTFFEQRLTLSRQLNYQRGIAYALRGLGEVATAQGRYVEANTWLHGALHIFAELGDRQYLAQIWQDLGRLAYHEHQLERADVAFQHSLAIYYEVDDRHSMADLWLDLSRLALASDDVAVAVERQEIADRLIQEQIDRRLHAASFMNRARIALRQHHISAARHYLEQALYLFDLLQHRAKLVEGIDLFAAIVMAEQRPVHALHLWSAAERVRRQMGLLSPVCDARQRQQQIDALSLHMSVDDFLSVWQTGQEWSLEQAMAEARSDWSTGRSQVGPGL